MGLPTATDAITFGRPRAVGLSTRVDIRRGGSVVGKIERDRPKGVWYVDLDGSSCPFVSFGFTLQEAEANAVRLIEREMVRASQTEAPDRPKDDTTDPVTSNVGSVAWNWDEQQRRLYNARTVCYGCGFGIEAGDRFCAGCGADLSGAVQAILATNPELVEERAGERLYSKDAAKVARDVLKAHGITGVSVRKGRGTAAGYVDVSFAVQAHDEAEVMALRHEAGDCPICQRHNAAREKLNAILERAMPGNRNKSDSQSDYHCFTFSINTHWT